MRFFSKLYQHWQLLSRAEDREGFRLVMLRLTGEGLAFMGWLGILATLFYLAGTAFGGSTFGFQYGVPNEVVLWDKIVIISLCGCCLVLSRFKSGLVVGRLYIASFFFVACFAMLSDDIASGSLTYSIPYMSIVLFIAVGTTPFKPRHALIFYLSIAFLYWGFSVYFKAIHSTSFDSTHSRLVFMFIITLLCIGINFVLYYTRFRQFEAQERAEALQKQTEIQAQQIKALEEAKTRFFTNVSHEFRTPLTLILGATHDLLTQSALLPPHLHQTLAMADRNAIRLQGLIDELLDLSKLDEGKLQLDIQPHELVSFAHLLTQSFEPIAQKKSIHLSFASNCEVLFTQFDAPKLDKTLSNLLSNALKFTSSKGTVSIQIHHDAPQNIAQITVTDTGMGIAKADQELIFDRFNQGQNTRNFGGSGLGLAFAKELVNLHGGTIEVASTEGVGSTFTVCLPIREVKEEDRASLLAQSHTQIGIEAMQNQSLNAEYKPDQAPQNAPLVLIIEDNEDMRLYINQQLKTRYRLLEASDGDEGIQLATKFLPDLVISDVMMPKKDGFEVCKILKTQEKTAHIPVVMLTARTTDADKMDGLKSGADDYLMKPFNPEELLTRTENLIEIRQLLRAKFSQSVKIMPLAIEAEASDTDKFLSRLQQIIESHLSNTEFGVEWLASEMAMSSRQLQRRIQEATNLSASGYIRAIRLQHAAHLLSNGIGNVSEVALRIGFQDAKYFSKLFQQTFGVLPSQFQA
jgi:signal transduction histidine kinase/DNA-binding response OmpR family regulator